MDYHKSIMLSGQYMTVVDMTKYKKHRISILRRACWKSIACNVSKILSTSKTNSSAVSLLLAFSFGVFTTIHYA